MESADSGRWVRRLGWPITLTALGLIAATWGTRRVINQIGDSVLRAIIDDPYHESLWQVVTQFQRSGSHAVLETDKRTASPHPILRPLGSPFAESEFNRIVFDVAQLAKLPYPENASVATDVVVGKDCARPLHLDIPLIVGAVGNAFLLNDRTRIALAAGATAAGTALNSGNAPYMPEERAACGQLIMQYHRGSWMQPADLRHADAVEIVLGEGAGGSSGMVLNNVLDASELAAIKPKGGTLTQSTRYPQMQVPADLPLLVDSVRHLAPGIPVGVRLAGNMSLEADLACVLPANVDFVTICGREAGTLRDLPTLQDSFGIPTLWALHRAKLYLDVHDPQHRISLLVTGGLSTPGDYLKCLALGAVAVCCCSATLFAVAARQQTKVTPFEPPTAILLHNPRYAQLLDIKQGQCSVHNWLLSSVAEMVIAARSLGIGSLRDLDISMLGALDKEAATALGIPYVADPAGTAPVASSATPAILD